MRMGNSFTLCNGHHLSRSTVLEYSNGANSDNNCQLFFKICFIHARSLVSGFMLHLNSSIYWFQLSLFFLINCNAMVFLIDKYMGEYMALESVDLWFLRGNIINIITFYHTFSFVLRTLQSSTSKYLNISLHAFS